VPGGRPNAEPSVAGVATARSCVLSWTEVAQHMVGGAGRMLFGGWKVSAFSTASQSGTLSGRLPGVADIFCSSSLAAVDANYRAKN
jgi:hypothetical protein